MARRLLVLWLFPLCLVAAQAGGVVHGFGHSPFGGNSKDRAGAGEACVQCVGFAKLSHVAVDTALPGHAKSVTLPVCGESRYEFWFVSAVAFEARGPPYRL